MRKFSFISLLSAIIAISAAHAQSTSPDGSILIENLTTSAGTWTFGAPYLPGNWWINLNGQQIYGAGSEMVVANGGQLYALASNNNWYLWIGNGWMLTGPPVLPAPPANPQTIPSPDGTILLASVQTAAGVWTFGAPYLPGNWWINLNGQQIYGAGSEMVVANGGQLYALGSNSNWYVWQNGAWYISSNPLPPPPATLTLTFSPQMPSILDNVPLGTVVATATAAWSDGSPFTGTLMFGAPYADDGGTFALSCTRCATANIVVSPTGLGVMGDGGTVQNITVTATQ